MSADSYNAVTWLLDRNVDEGRGIKLGELRAVRDAKKAELAGAIALCQPSALQEVW